MASVRTERGFDRLVNFSDATVAIALTLLILPLVDIAGEISHTSLGEVLNGHLGDIAGFVITFAVIARLWLFHHQVFETMQTYNHWLMWANMLWLISIVFLPFAANLLSNITQEEPGVYALYIGTMIVSSGAIALIRWLLLKYPELLREDSRGSVHLLGSVVTTSLLVIALVLAVLVPAVNMFWLLLLFTAAPIERLIGRRSRHNVTS